MIFPPTLGVTVEKDGRRYACELSHDNLWWCGACNKYRIRVYRGRSWEKLDDSCKYCGAKLAGIKTF